MVVEHIFAPKKLGNGGNYDKIYSKNSAFSHL